jgi:hypothetical protein
MGSHGTGFYIHLGRDIDKREPFGEKPGDLQLARGQTKDVVTREIRIGRSRTSRQRGDEHTDRHRREEEVAGRTVQWHDLKEVRAAGRAAGQGDQCRPLWRRRCGRDCSLEPRCVIAFGRNEATASCEAKRLSRAVIEAVDATNAPSPVKLKYRVAALV